MRIFTNMAMSLIVSYGASAQDCDYQTFFPASFYVVDTPFIDITVNQTAVISMTAAQDLANTCFFDEQVDISGESFLGPYTFLIATAFSPDAVKVYSNYARADAVAGSWPARGATGVWIELLWGRVGRTDISTGETCCAPGDSLAFAAAACDFEVSSSAILISEIELSSPSVINDGQRAFYAAIDKGSATSIASLLLTANGNSVAGWTYNATTETWEYYSETPLVANQSVNLDIILVRVEDSRLDVNFDGRPNGDDGAELDSVVGTASAFDPDYTNYYDYDRDGEITGQDVVIHALILNAGADAGFVNDTDGSGVVDCDDLPILIPSVGAVIGDADYYVQVDRDLDGAVSLEERREFLLDLQPADANLDGIVQANDFSAWIAAFNLNDSAADASRDGSVNANDFSAWIAAFNTGGCS